MIRLLKASPFYDSYLDDFYAKNPEMLTAAYEVQLKNIMKEAIGWADFWKTNIEKSGRYEVMEIITTARVLQTQWAKENNITYTEKGWMYEILEAQIKNFQPDIFFPHDYFNLDSHFILRIRQEVKSIKLVIGYDGYGLGDATRFKGTDLMLSCARFICDFYTQHGFESCFLPFGFENSILAQIKQRAPLYDISFCGSLIVRANFHNERLRLLAGIADKLPLSLWAASFPQNWKPWQKDQLRRIKHGRYQEFFDVWKLGRINKGTLSGLDMYQCLADSKFTLNHHIDVSGQVAGNSRLIEATGVGTCLVTDWKPNLNAFFEPDTEVVTFKTPAEAIDKIKYLLLHETERKKIALAGQKRTLEHHSFEARMNNLIPVLDTLLAKV